MLIREGIGEVFLGKCIYRFKFGRGYGKRRKTEKGYGRRIRRGVVNGRGGKS